MGQQISKRAAQIVFDEISKPRGPSDKIQAVISLCVENGAETFKEEAPPPPAPEPTIEPEAVADTEVAEPSDNAFGEGSASSE